MVGAWVANTLDEVIKTCVVLLNSNVNEIDMVIKDQDRDNSERYLSLVIRRNQPQEGDDESAGKSNKDFRTTNTCP